MCASMPPAELRRTKFELLAACAYSASQTLCILAATRNLAVPKLASYGRLIRASASGHLCSFGARASALHPDAHLNAATFSTRRLMVADFRKWDRPAVGGPRDDAKKLTSVRSELGIINLSNATLCRSGLPPGHSGVARCDHRAERQLHLLGKELGKPRHECLRVRLRKMLIEIGA
jgi:hypothetical protein